MSIAVKDVKTEKATDVTHLFTTTLYDNKTLTVKQAVAKNLFSNGYIYGRQQFDMIEDKGIPDLSIFEVKAVLYSGAEIAAQTQPIQFK